MKKPMKIVLGIAGVAALLGICFACLSVYAKKEINKPKFVLPEIVSEQPASPLPSTKEEAFDYVYALYGDCVAADDIELSRHTDVHLTEGERVTPFAEEDNAVFSRALETAQGAVGGLYPSCESTLITQLKDVPSLDFTKADVTDFTAVKGTIGEDGETVDDGYYYITLTLNPQCLNTKAMREGDIRERIEKELAPMLSLSTLDIVPNSFTASFKIDYAADRLTYVALKRNVTVKAAVDFTEDYQALSGDTAVIEMPYEAVQHIDLFHYGLHFTERQLAAQKSDIKALPLEVNVNPEATKNDYQLSFEVSKDGILEIDEDGVMNVIGAQEEPVTVTAVLEYDGHTYTDELIVYATEWEVKTDEQEHNG